MRCPYCNRIISDTPHGRQTHDRHYHPEHMQLYYGTYQAVPQDEAEAYLIEQAIRRRDRRWRKGMHV